MAATDHPLVLDLGSVVGPQGPQGPSGISTTSGAPSPTSGSDGDVRIDPANGNVYKKANGAWSVICTMILAPLDASIDPDSGNGVTNAAVAAALGGKIGTERVSTTLEMGGSGDYPEGHQIDSFGPIAFLSVAGTNRNAGTWSKTVTVGDPTVATTICTIPEFLRSAKTQLAIGKLLTASKEYKAVFTVYSSESGANSGRVTCSELWDVVDGVLTMPSASQVTATSFSFSSVWCVARQEAAT